MTPEPSALQLRCPCGKEMWSFSDGEWVLLLRVLVVGDARQLFARCPTCRKRVHVPFLALVQPVVEAEPQQTRRRVVVPAGGASA